MSGCGELRVPSAEGTSTGHDDSAVRSTASWLD